MLDPRWSVGVFTGVTAGPDRAPHLEHGAELARNLGGGWEAFGQGATTPATQDWRANIGVRLRF